MRQQRQRLRTQVSARPSPGASARPAAPGPHGSGARCLPEPAAGGAEGPPGGGAAELRAGAGARGAAAAGGERPLPAHPSPEARGRAGEPTLPACFSDTPSWSSSCRPGPRSSWRRRPRTRSCGGRTRRCGRSSRAPRSSSADWRATRAVARSGPSGATPRTGRGRLPGRRARAQVRATSVSACARRVRGAWGVHLHAGHASRPQGGGRGVQEHAEGESEPAAAAGAAQVRGAPLAEGRRRPRPKTPPQPLALSLQGAEHAAPRPEGRQ